MIRLRALNEESSEESEGDDEIPPITKEAQEQTAFSQYNKALSFLQEKNLAEAELILQELLQCNFLADVTKAESLGQPSLLLKYSCLKNLGNVLEQQKDLEGALQHYLQAAELDDSDVMLWFRVGTMAVKLLGYELACDAFLEGLRCSPRNWPCLDSLVTILYVLNDYIPCLLHIARALELDPDFLKGLALRDKILEEQPSIVLDFQLYCKGYDLGPLKTDYDHDIGKELVEEALAMREARRPLTQALFTPRAVKTVSLVQPPITLSWLVLGESLVMQHHHATEHNMSYCCRVKLEKAQDSVDTHAEPEEVKEEKLPEVDQVDPMEVKMEDGEVGDAPATTPLAPAPSNIPEEVIDIPGPTDGEDTKNRKRRRSSLSFLEHWMWGGKRRSARVRSTVRREAERDECNLGEALRRLVPPALLPNTLKDEKPKDVDTLRSTEDSLDTMDLYKLFERRESSDGRGDDKSSEAKAGPSPSRELLQQEGYFGSEQEISDIENFLVQHNGHDIIDLLNSFLQALSNHWQLTWPKQLPRLFMEAYHCMREHISHPSVLSSEEEPEWVINDAWMTLLNAELCIDQWLQDKMASQEVTSSEELQQAEALGQLMLVSMRNGLHPSYIPRLYWLKAHAFLNQGNVNIAMQSLDTLLYYLDEEQQDQSKGTAEQKVLQRICLPNCRHHNLISRESAQKLLTTLTRNQNLSEVQRLYDEKHYEELVEILQETFRYNQQSGMAALNSCAANCPDRATQLAMLMDALWQLKKYQDCFFWGEACCNEALHKYLNSEDKEQQKWASTIEKLLSGLESCITKAGLIVVDSPRLSRLVQNLTHMLCHQMEAPDTQVEMPIESVLPWILLQQILQREEEKEPTQSSTEERDEGQELPGYIMVLFTAHDYLSRRSWCCSNEGSLLLHTMDVVIPRLRSPQLATMRDRLTQGMEQVFFCLYAHPSKKNKTRYLQDHGVPQVALTWERAIQLYQFYQPIELPEFDSYRVGSITADVEALFKRIITLIPQQYDPVPLVDKMSQYIEGHTTQLPRPPTTHGPLPKPVATIYYLLADFYFKNNEWAKAIRHYLLDVCVNPVRLDSWAGMALARGSQLETKLNSRDFNTAAIHQWAVTHHTEITCEHLKSEGEFLRQAASAQRCFRRALEIESSHSLLWIEYGSFVYMVHSFCSRLLKQETDSLSLEMFDVLETQKEEMLDVAVQCFTSANKVWYAIGEDSGLQDERWLHHYMLGKVAEKRDLTPAEYLDHYSKASNFLNINGASYARKVSYNNPQNMAVEALEIYYRIHACILKWLEQNEVKSLDQTVLALFQRCLQEAADGPFMAVNNKDLEGRGESDEDKRKRPASGPLEEEPPDTKKIHVEQPGDLCVMEDVIDIMEDMIGKVADNPGEECILPHPVDQTPVITTLIAKNPTLPQETDDDMEVVEISDDSVQMVGEEKVQDPLGVEDFLQDTPEEPKGEIFLGETTPIKFENILKLDAVTTGIKIECTEEIVGDEKSDASDNKDTKSECIENKEGEKNNEGSLEIDPTKATAPQQSTSADNYGAKPEELAAIRRGSQESTTTTTETSTSAGNSSSSSENDSSSSSDESSESSSSSESGDSSDSDSDEANQSTETVVASSAIKKKGSSVCKDKEENSGTGKTMLDFEENQQGYDELVQRCLIALEECVLRFPQHYKSLYRLTHYYFRSKLHRDVLKCRDLLLGCYKCQTTTGRASEATFQGLFAERKNNNFFNGVWRIPVSEVDRPGSFASHMSRCVLLLMDVLRELRDHRTLLELCLQLRRTPDPDKKYLRDSEREQLSRQALSLALQALRTKMREECSASLVVDVYRAYQRVQKHLPQKEAVFASLLTDTYKKHIKCDTTDLEQAVRFCQQEIMAIRAATAAAAAAASAATSKAMSSNISTIPLTQVPNPQSVNQISTALQQRKVLAPGSKPIQPSMPASQPSQRPRGRPVGSTKVSRTMDDPPFDYVAAKAAAKAVARKFSNRINVPPKTTMAQPQLPVPLPQGLPYYPIHSIFPEPDFLTAAVNSKIPPMIDPQMALSMLQAHMSGYQAEFFRHFAASALGTVSPMSPAILSGLPIPHVNTVRSPTSSYKGSINTPTSSQKSSTAAEYIKDRPNISITPITSPVKSGCKSISSPSLQHKLAAGKTVGRSTSSSSSVSTTASVSVAKSNLQKSSTTPPTYLGIKDSKYNPQSSKTSSSSQYMSLLKNREVLTSSVSISQINPSTNKPNTSKLITYRKNSSSPLQNLPAKDGMGITSDSVINRSSKSNQSVSNILPHRGKNNNAYSNQTAGPRGQIIEPRENFKTMQGQGSGAKSSRNQSSSLRNIGREITVTSAPQTMLNCLPLSLPKSITITPKQQQQQQPEVVKKGKDTVSITELNRGKRAPPSPVKKPDSERKEGPDVEVITLE